MYDSQNLTGADSQTECTERVSTSSFTIDEEVVLSKVRRAVSNASRPASHTVHGDLSCLVNADTIEIEGFEGNA